MSHRDIKPFLSEINEKEAKTVSVGEHVAVHSIIRAVKLGVTRGVIASFSPMGVCSNGEITPTCSRV